MLSGIKVRILPQGVQPLNNHSPGDAVIFLKSSIWLDLKDGENLDCDFPRYEAM
jgi:hypothetical protein